MTNNPSHLDLQQGKFRHAFSVAWVFLQSLESTGYDYTLDRIERLEREVEQLKREIRKSRDPGEVDTHNASAVALEQ